MGARGSRAASSASSSATLSAPPETATTTPAAASARERRHFRTMPTSRRPLSAVRCPLSAIKYLFGSLELRDKPCQPAAPARQDCQPAAPAREPLLALRAGNQGPVNS